MKTFTAFAVLPIAFASVVSFAGEESQVPKEVAEVLEFYVGNWSLEGTVGDEPLKGKASFRMPAGKHCIIGTVSFQADGEPLHFSLVSGWDSSTGWITEQGSESTGEVYSIRWAQVSPTVDEGEVVGTVEGKKTSAAVRLERKGDDKCAVSITKRMQGAESLPDMKFVYHKVVRKRANVKKAKK